MERKTRFEKQKMAEELPKKLPELLTVVGRKEWIEKPEFPELRELFYLKAEEKHLLRK